LEYEKHLNQDLENDEKYSQQGNGEEDGIDNSFTLINISLYYKQEYFLSFFMQKIILKITFIIF